MKFKDKRVGILMGGLSSEREVSLNTGKNVLRAVQSKGYDAVGLDWTPDQDLTTLLRDAKVEVVWIALHGTYGEDGCVQGLLECLKLPYTGSGVIPSAAAMDKLISKDVFRQNDVDTPAHVVLRDGDDPHAAAARLGWPVVVKPSREGSTVGITIVKDASGLSAAVDLARKCHGQTFLEAFVPGRELSVGILDGEVLGTVEIRPKMEFYDYQAKYVTGDTEYLVPAPVSAVADARCRELSRKAYVALGCQGHSRVDVRLDPGDNAYVLEVNTLPGMTGTSLLPKIAAHAGMDYATLCERILDGAGLKA
jgi:D-alanine-D-alanine ligase